MSEGKHSGLGIASFVLSIFSGVGLFLAIAAAAVMAAVMPGAFDETSAGAIVLGLGIFALLGCSLVAFGLGVAGLFQKERKRVFAVLGTVFAAATLAVGLAVMIVGMVQG